MDPTVKLLKKVLSEVADTGSIKCGFRFQQFASLVASSSISESLELLLPMVRSHRWEDVYRLQTWRGDADNVLVYAVEFEEGNGALLAIFDPHELYADKQLLAYENLAHSDLDAIRGLRSGEPWTSVPA